MANKHIALRVNEIKTNQYYIVLPHKCYATVELFNYLNNFILNNYTEVKEMSLTDEGYICLISNNYHNVLSLADKAGSFIFNEIDKG